LTNLITRDVPLEILRTLDLNTKEYRINGSVGQGSWAEIPWIAIMHRGITSSTRTGYYIALLYTADLKHIYVTLGLGWTQFQAKYGTKNGLSKIVSFSYQLSKKLDLDDDDITEMIHLGATATLGRGYEAGNICAYRFVVANIDEGDLEQVLERYLEFYWQLIDEVGADVFFDETETSIEIDMDDNVKQAVSRIRQLSSSTNKGSALVALKSLADTLPPKKREYIATRTIRNRAFADYVKARADYKCEMCGRQPFLKKDGTPYAEADHVSPLYNFGVDHPDNMRCLCAQCHRIVTYGSHEEIAKLTNS
jgi:5-methylcytosine-specific restriction protein A